MRINNEKTPSFSVTEHKKPYEKCTLRWVHSSRLIQRIYIFAKIRITLEPFSPS